MTRRDDIGALCPKHNDEMRAHFVPAMQAEILPTCGRMAFLLLPCYSEAPHLMLKSTSLALIAIALFVAVFLHAEERMRAGLWEVITTHDGKPSGNTGSTCYTPAMVQLGNTPAANLKEAIAKSMVNRHCSLTDFKLDGNKVSMTTVCGARSSVVTTTYSADAFETTGTTTNQGVATVTNMKGRRLGDCK